MERHIITVAEAKRVENEEIQTILFSSSSERKRLVLRVKRGEKGHELSYIVTAPGKEYEIYNYDLAIETYNKL